MLAIFFEMYIFIREIPFAVEKENKALWQTFETCLFNFVRSVDLIQHNRFQFSVAQTIRMALIRLTTIFS